MKSRRPMVAGALVLAGGVASLLAQAPPPGKKAAGTPMQSRSASTITYTSKDGEETVEINNVAFELTGDSIPGRPPNSRLVLRTTTHSTQVLGDKGVEATVTMEAWPLQAGLNGKPLYSVKTPGIGAQTLDGELWVADRSIDPDATWWSIYKLGTGQHLLDTYVELLRFSISRETLKQRYAGLDVPPDDTTDARLKDPKLVAILGYASADKVIREVLVTCDNRERAAILRSYSDSTRTLTIVERSAGEQSIRIAIDQNYPSAANRTVVSIPIAKDDLDLAHAELPAGFHVAAFRR
ncbi:MAG TPA: hypothetical protein VGH38_24780 [Bryobacteraceae bacterium]